MIYFAGSLKHLKEAVDSLIKVLGEDACVGSAWKKEDNEQFAYFDDLVQLEYVFIDSSNNIVGDEANDYEPKEGERPAVLIGGY